jgi:hypothetical protein
MAVQGLAMALRRISMRRAVPGRLVLFAVCIVGGTAQTPALAAQGTSGAQSQWEYRVLTKDRLLELGKKDVAAALNRLGDEGWELIGIEPPSAAEPGSGATAKPATFYFKRPRSSTRSTEDAQDLKDIISRLEYDVELAREWASWTERMHRKGFRSQSHVSYAKQELKDLELALARAKRQLKALEPEPIKAPEKMPKSEK